MNLRGKLPSIIFVLFIALVIVLSVNQLAQAQPGGLYEMTGAVVPGGTTIAGSYQIDAAIGQATIAQNTAGPYELGSGVWGGGLLANVIEELRVFLPILLR